MQKKVIKVEMSVKDDLLKSLKSALQLAKQAERIYKSDDKLIDQIMAMGKKIPTAINDSKNIVRQMEQIDKDIDKGFQKLEKQLKELGVPMSAVGDVTAAQSQLQGADFYPLLKDINYYAQQLAKVKTL